MDKTTPTAPAWLPPVLAGIQFACIGAVLATGPLWATAPWLLGMQIAAVGLGLWAIGVMRPGRFNLTHRPRPGAPLVERGPYAVIRHPMYLAVLLFCGALVAARPTPLRLGLGGLLLADLLLKLHLEEEALMAERDGYAAYRERTYRLIPFLY